jgi:hypothetical protein
MHFFEGVVRDCDALAFVRFDDYTVGAGVGKEIQVALDCELPVFELASPRTGVSVVRVHEMPEPVLTVEETRDRLNLIRGGKLLIRACPDCQGKPELKEDPEGRTGGSSTSRALAVASGILNRHRSPPSGPGTMATTATAGMRSTFSTSVQATGSRTCPPAASSVQLAWRWSGPRHLPTAGRHL